MKKEKKKSGFSSLVVILAVLHIDLFIALLLYLYYMGYSFSDTAVTCFFSFWAVEMISIAGIKIGKVRYNYGYEESLENSMEEENYEN
jgi:hypothetical protein